MANLQANVAQNNKGFSELRARLFFVLGAFVVYRV